MTAIAEPQKTGQGPASYGVFAHELLGSGPAAEKFLQTQGVPPRDWELFEALLEFDADGKYIREIGHNLYAWSFAHAVRVDAEDNIWVADKGSDMVVKFRPDGR